MDIDVPTFEHEAPTSAGTGSPSLPSHDPGLHLPTFSGNFPLPFRVLVLIGLAILLWAINLHVLSALAVDTSWALDIGEEVGQEEDAEQVDVTGGLLGRRENGGAYRDGFVGSSEATGEVASVDRNHGDKNVFPPGEVINLSTPELPSTPDPNTRLHIHIPSARSPTLSALNSPGLPSDAPHRFGGGQPNRALPESLYGPVYRLFLVYTLWVGSAWLLFCWMTSSSVSSDLLEDMIALEGDKSAKEEMLGQASSDNLRSQRELMESPGVRLFVTLVMVGTGVGIVAPWKGFGKQYRHALTRSFHRILRPRLTRPPYFSDVILADILTSFAKVLGDIIVSAHQLWAGGISEGRVRLSGVGQWVVLGMVCLPYLLRFQQCAFEYLNPSNTSTRPLLNAIKYASAFPVIILSAMQRNVIKEVAMMQGKTAAEFVVGRRWFGEHRMFRLWLLAVIVNSMYSFWWDVTNDWGLCLLTPSTWAKQPSLPAGLGISASPIAPRMHLRTTSSGGIRTAFRPMFLTQLAQKAMRMAGLGGEATSSGGYRPVHRLNPHQRSPYPFAAPQSRTGSHGVQLNGKEINDNGQELRSQATERGLSPSPFFGPETSITHTTSIKPLFSNRYVTIPNPLYLGLRSTLLFPDPLVYHLFIGIDFVLRFIWSLKLSSHLHTISEIESGVFIMEALELARRWMWVFLRVEWEVVKKMESRRNREWLAHGSEFGGEAFAMGSMDRRTQEGVVVVEPEPTSPRKRNKARLATSLTDDDVGLMKLNADLAAGLAEAKEPVTR